MRLDTPWRLTVLLALGPVGLAWAAPAFDGAAEQLGVQQCNTRCQTAYTDCIDRCDGKPDCQASCDRDVVACVKACSTPLPPGSSAPLPTPPAPSSTPPAPSAAPSSLPGKGKPAPPKLPPKPGTPKPSPS
ncbi:MAG TPA: hypothetical protein VH062_08275 [Polyangiaceae bacterium]|nr:hypothetical protein [Polyangiaceae bacterium]